MKIKQIILFFILLQLVLSCAKKKYPESTIDNESVYYSRMTVDGQQVEIKAGEENYYLYTSATQDSTNTYTFGARLATSDCASCPGTLQFQITDFSNSKVGSVAVTDSPFVSPRNYLRDGLGPQYSVEFRASYNRSAVSNYVNWDFGDGAIASGFVVNRVYKGSGPYQVCLSVRGDNGCVSSNCNVQNFAPGKMRAFVKSTNPGRDSVLFSAKVSGGKTPYSYSWDFGDGTVGTDSVVLHNYNVSGAYGVILFVKDANGKVVSSNYNVVTSKDNSSCAANYSIVSVSTSTNGIQDWGKVRIKYTLPNGSTYSSSSIDQSSNSKFEILSMEDAGLNEKGEKIKKLKITFSATLFNGTKNINIENGEAIIAIVYP